SLAIGGKETVKVFALGGGRHSISLHSNSSFIRLGILTSMRGRIGGLSGVAADGTSSSTAGGASFSTMEGTSLSLTSSSNGGASSGALTRNKRTYVVRNTLATVPWSTMHDSPSTPSNVNGPFQPALPFWSFL